MNLGGEQEGTFENNFKTAGEPSRSLLKSFGNQEA
jgi:hypothetical protein